MDLKTTFTIAIKESSINELKTLISDSKKVTSIRVGIEATHSGIVNKNYKFYTPVGMKNGADSFTKPYNKPVTVNHSNVASPIGRVVSAEYVQYNTSTDVNSLSTSTNAKFLDKIKKYVASADYSAMGYKGLGHLYLVAEITDADAIQKIIDRRYMTVSIGGGSNAMYCSICGVNNMADYCNHYPGQTYEDEKCYFISGDQMEFDHVSYVNSPADVNTASEILDMSEDTKITILDYVLEDKKGTKMTLKELLKSKYSEYDGFKEYMESKQLSKHINEDAFASAKPAQFLLSEDKLLPVFDTAHAMASLLILKEQEESDDKKAMIATVEDLLQVMNGQEYVIEDGLVALQSEKADPASAETQPVAPQTIVISDEHIAQIIAGVTSGMKEAFNVSDSFSIQRIKSLQRANIDLENEVQNISDKYRKNVINQILAIEDKLTDADYADKLDKRSILSLEDKLADISVNKSVDTNTNANDNKQLDPASVSIEDAAKNEGEDASAAKPDGSKVEKLKNEEILDAYQSIRREKGFAAAKQYIQTLKDENKIPDNFTFNGVK